MAIIGASAPFLFIPRPIFRPFDLIFPSCLTWLLLQRTVKGKSIPTTIGIGILSTVVGAAFVLLLGSGVVREIKATNLKGFLGGMVYAMSYIVITAPVTLPTGIGTALLIRKLFKWFGLSERK